MELQIRRVTLHAQIGRVCLAVPGWNDPVKSNHGLRCRSWDADGLDSLAGSELKQLDVHSCSTGAFFDARWRCVGLATFHH